VSVSAKPRVRDDLAVVDVGDEAVLFDPRTEQVHHLNREAKMVFELCDGTATLAETAADLGSAIGIDVAELAPQIESVARSFAEVNLFAPGPDPELDQRIRIRTEVPHNA
jgi:hypothetical protein